MAEEGKKEEENQADVQAEETRARLTGWAPEDEFKGDPDKWSDAAAWNDRADKILPIMRASNKRLETDLISTRAELENLKRVMNSIVKTNEKVSKRQYERALETLRKEQAQAITDQDPTKFADLEKQKDALEKPQIIKTQPGQQPGPHPEFQQWVVDNPWYTDDPERRTYADSQVSFVTQMNPSLTGRQFFDAVKKEVEGKFPDRFKNPNRKKKSNVDAGGDTRGGGGSKKGKTYADLPDDAKKVCDGLVKDIEGYKKEEYVKDYFEEE